MVNNALCSFCAKMYRKCTENLLMTCKNPTYCRKVYIKVYCEMCRPLLTGILENIVLIEMYVYRKFLLFPMDNNYIMRKLAIVRIFFTKCVSVHHSIQKVKMPLLQISSSTTVIYNYVITGNQRKAMLFYLRLTGL